jgi:hypothetical protein
MEYFERILDLEEPNGKTTYDLNNDYQNLLEFVTSYVEADCYQVTVDNVDIFHVTNDLTIKNHIMEQIIRDKIIADPHRSIFCPMLRKSQCFTVEIYLFQSTPWKIVIDYRYDEKLFYVKTMVSQLYIDKFEK